MALIEKQPSLAVDYLIREIPTIPRITSRYSPNPEYQWDNQILDVAEDCICQSKKASKMYMSDPVCRTQQARIHVLPQSKLQCKKARFQK